MLQSAKPLGDETLLKNANTLRHHFTPRFPFHNALSINKEGEIVVLDNQFDRSSPLHNTFSQEKYIMIWHFGCLEDFIKRRLKEIAQIPITNLKTYYQVAKVYENLTFLCENYVSHLIRLKEMIAEKEKQPATQLSGEQKLHFEFLDKEFKAVLIKAQIRLIAITKAHKDGLTKSMVIGFPGFHGQATLRMPLYFEIGQFTLGAEEAKIIAHFEHEEATFRCKDSIHVHMVSPSPSLSFCTLVYPAWSEKTLFAPLTLKKLELCPNGPTEYLTNHIKAKKCDMIGFKPASLIVTLKGEFDQALPSLKYFQFMVELGLQMPGRFEQVIFYGPNTLAPLAYAAGFRSNDALRPNLEEQRLKVVNACRLEQPVERLQPEDTLFENLEELYRPFYFDLNTVRERNVRIPNNPEGQQKTSYECLIEAQTMLKDRQPLLPDFYGIPSKPFCHSFNDRRTREITGRLPMDALIHSVEAIDLNALGSNKELEGVFPIESSETVGKLKKAKNQT